MDNRVDIKSGEAVYQQIATHFKRLIVTGELPPGSHLPQQRQLARELGVNRSTVSAAYDELLATGLIRSRQGHGTWVSEDAWGMSVAPAPDWVTYLAQGTYRPTQPLMHRLWEANRQSHNINFARGEMSSELWPTSQIHSLLRQLPAQMPLGYGDPRGEHSLRVAVSHHLKHHYGLDVPPHRILITAGSQQGLTLLAQGLLRPGDAIGLERPSYAYSLPILTSAGLRPFPISVDADGLQPEEIPILVRRHKIRMIFMTPTYQNPTSTTLPLLRRYRLLQTCIDLGIPLVEDDAHGVLTLDGTPPPPKLVAALPGADQHVIYIGTLSKTVAPGLRVGWMTGPSSVIERLAGIREQMDFGLSVVSQSLAEKILDSDIWHPILTQLLTALSRRRDRMVKALNQYLSDSLSFAVPRGGYHIWARLAQPMGDVALVEAALKQRVVVVPGSAYGAEPGYVRLTYASSGENEIDEGVRRLQRALLPKSPH